MTDDWFRAFVHEGGHVIMADIYTIRCHGIFLKRPKIKACNLVDPLPPALDLSNELRLYLAAGSAAEQITFGKAELAGSQEDQKSFGNPPNITFEEKVKEAETIILRKKVLIETLASRLEKLVKDANGNFSNFREQKAGMNGVIDVYWVLLNETELKDAIQGVQSDSP
jgi:hypothetical protein